MSGTASNPPSYHEGDPVNVRYWSNDPTDARIDTLTGIFLGAIITGGLSLFFAAFTRDLGLASDPIPEGPTQSSARAARMR